MWKKVRQLAEDLTCGEAHGGAGRQHEPDPAPRNPLLLQEGRQERRLESLGAEQDPAGAGKGAERASSA